ncbi:H(+)-transporting V0 sector ATPase subunit a [Aspergillus hancockii]|nr:H(+)-transporting V0 sector ATPase subunit a [Aspergillus hancockii]
MAPKDTFFRSVDMSRIQIFIVNENEREVVMALGELGQVQFRDLNQDTNALKRTFTGEVSRLNDVGRQLRYFRSQLDKASIPIRRPSSESPDTLAVTLTSDIEGLIEGTECLEQQISSLNDSYETLMKREEEIRQSLNHNETPLLRDIEQQARPNDAAEGPQRFLDMSIGIIAGSDIPNLLSIQPTMRIFTRNVFMILVHGKSITAKIRNISESLGASLYSVDEDCELRKERMHGVSIRLNDVKKVMQRTKNILHTKLMQIASVLAAWVTIIKKERAIYDTLNQFSYGQARSTHIAEAWCPTNSLPLIEMTLQGVNDRAGLTVPTIISRIRTNTTPPTFIRTNKFTEGFQKIVDAYGIPKYSEFNPGLYTLPAAMICWEGKLGKTKLDELIQMAFYGRYIMLMMGLFSMYTGFLYNDVFSGSFTFPSQWKWPNNIRQDQIVKASLRDGYRFPFGVDWNWHNAENSLLFTNSMKMKMSILLGW